MASPQLHNSIESALHDEMLLLEAMYPNELQYDRAKSQISIQLKPNTAMDSTKQFVQCLLVFNTKEDYPASIPDISIVQERGISESDKTSMIQRLKAKAKEELIGTPMLFSLIEEGKELLTMSNKPSEGCSICLCPFEEDDDETTIVRTPCFHYFHRDCFISWWRKGTKSCPVCRQDINEQDPLVANLALELTPDDSNDESVVADTAAEETSLSGSDGESDTENNNSPTLPQQQQQSQQQQTSESYEDEHIEVEYVEGETEEEWMERIEQERLRRQKLRQELRRPEPLLIVQYTPPQHLFEKGYIEPRKSPTFIKQIFVPFGCVDCKAKITTIPLRATLDATRKAEIFVVKFRTRDQALFAHANFPGMQSAREYLTCNTISKQDWDTLSPILTDPETPYQESPSQDETKPEDKSETKQDAKSDATTAKDNTRSRGSSNSNTNRNNHGNPRNQHHNRNHNHNRGNQNKPKKQQPSQQPQSQPQSQPAPQSQQSQSQPQPAPPPNSTSSSPPSSTTDTKSVANATTAAPTKGKTRHRPPRKPKIKQSVPVVASPSQ
eukprot:TRINITY_DN6198_c0_g1_i1.p1 TRINITY_DN6198_c0_g1~~TRINITY_DN6198_c0_g1_i1.p1  ORF type:complete len:554 (+),score=154.17 TRINITY_DN6198_c0_g1_i1:159-1820(+)